MIDKKLEAAFNEQINKEFYSEYLYLAMKIKFMEWNLQGFVNWFNVQVSYLVFNQPSVYPKTYNKIFLLVKTIRFTNIYIFP